MIVNEIRAVAFLGNSPPRRCGLATFTNDLQQAITAAREDLRSCIVAMTDPGQVYDYPAAVGFQIHDERLRDYRNAADFLNAGGFDVLSVQHEFGIFGGDAGDHLLSLLPRLKMPIVTTLHTVLAEPTATQRRVMNKVVECSAKVVVMAEKGRTLLQDTYGVPSSDIAIIPHGIPEMPFIEPGPAKAALGFGGKSVILTFGLLSPNKGIEVMIDAMPAILQRRPDAVYVVLGATHPNLVRRQGEAYRERLIARTRERGIDTQVVFLDQFVDQPTLLDFIAMADVYASPYLSEAQMTSGTLAYSFGLGKAVVSTPYWHARELLADGRGVLVPFSDPQAMAAEIGDLLTCDHRRYAMRAGAYAHSRSMTWARTAEHYLGLFDSVRTGQRLRVVTASRPTPAAAGRRVPNLAVSHLLAMCDDTGLLQHAVHSTPDRRHGYCVDDNARALLLSCALGSAGEQALPDTVSERFTGFIQHAWNPEIGRFRNFMSFDRRWLEDAGSEDSHGRAVWALGACARGDAKPSRRRWAAALLAEALPVVETFSSPRAWAFTLLGLDDYCACTPDDGDADRIRGGLAARLMSILSACETSDWVWFESGLSYDNARLPHALLLTGTAIGAPGHVEAALRTLGWLTAQQTAAAGHFRPIGSESFSEGRGPPRHFDQQPLEAAATVSACMAAWRLDGGADWKAEAERAFAWVLGENDLATPLVDLDTGGCRDGLHPDRANENQGAESVLSYLLSLVEMRRLAHLGDEPLKRAPLVAVSS
jgi:glycosyltransferase involved in cell wall biosynthesis